MWKTLGKAITPVIKEALILSPENVLQQQFRTTFILKRKTAPYLHKNGSLPKRLRSRHYVYELVKDTNVDPDPNINVILTTYIAGLGDIGDRVAVRPNIGYNKLLLTGMAVYASPENIEKFKDYDKKSEEIVHSSATSQRAVNCLSKMTLSVVMNRENSWTLKPWHIKASFRKCGYHVPEDTITLPPKPIVGPDMDLESKEFYITVTVNNLEKVNVRCRIHHWSTDVVERLPYDYEFWKKKSEAIFPEDAAVLASLPPNKTSEAKTNV